MNRIKDRSHTVILVNIEKAFHKIQHPFMNRIYTVKYEMALR